MSDYSQHSIAARLALAKAEQQALLGNYEDARVLLDTAIRESKLCRFEVIGKRHANQADE